MIKTYKDLDRSISGDVLLDEVSRSLYATDASVYEELPQAVIRPKNKHDCVEIIKFTQQNGLSLIPRAAGTSIAGQCVGHNIIVDVSRYMTSILSDVENNTIRVEPGVIHDDLNDVIADTGLKFAPDIATSNRCMIGGMIGNNAAGPHSILYGTTRDHVMEVEVILSDGSLTTFGPLSEQELEEKQKLTNTEGQIYRMLISVVNKHHDRIIEAFPKQGIVRRNTGYPLDHLANNQPWNKDGKKFNLAPFLCGSEGTLAFITEARLRLSPVIKGRRVICIHYADLMEAMRSVSLLLDFKPAAIELLDRRILDLAKENVVQNKNRFWIKGEPEAVLVTEFHDNNDGLNEKISKLEKFLDQQKIGYAHSVIKDSDIAKVWEIRKAGLGLLMGINQRQKPVAVIEDAAVLPADLPDYVSDIQKLMQRLKTKCVFYGHASVGLLHLRPELDLHDQSDRNKFKQIAEEVSELVLKYKGALSGEHGDGRVRAPYLKQQVGDKVYELFKKVKSSFDPENIFNPGKIISDQAIETNLRGENLAVKNVATQFNWHGETGFQDAVERCNGVGACRKSAGRGMMCPTYMATKDEEMSTRGRASVLRHIYFSNEPLKGIGNKRVKEIMDMCLSCKGCKSECPSNVDMARLKSEFLSQYYKVKGKSIEVIIVQYHGTIMKLLSIFSRTSNMLLKSGLPGRILRISGKTKLPLFSTDPFTVKQNVVLSHNKNKGKVVLLVDIFTRYFEPEIADAAQQVLKKSGYEVIPVCLDQSIRLLISYGLLKEAKNALTKLIKKIQGYSNLPIIGIEPSELLTLKDEAMDLVSADEFENFSCLSKQCFLFEEFFEHIKKDKNFSSCTFSKEKNSYLIHVHCHQKSLTGTASALNVLQDLPGTTAKIINSGCCGMAGSFGYKHQTLASKIANLSLVPAIKDNSDCSTIIAAGFSCRQQIMQETGIRAYHPAHVLNSRAI